MSSSPLRNIWAVGRNYAEHAKELGNEVPTTPLIFLKAGSTATLGSEIQIPAWCEDVHHEVELALRFNEKLQIDQIALALDLTERKMQSQLKAKGQPWTLAKSFTGSCPLSPFVKISNLTELENLSLSLSINGQIRQEGVTSQMLFKPAQLVDYVCQHFPVCPGDLLLTGTPSGVGPLLADDQLEAHLGTLLRHSWRVLKATK